MQGKTRIHIRRLSTYILAAGFTFFMLLAIHGFSFVSAKSFGSSSAPAQAPLNGFILSGDPTSANGATWTYQDTVDGVVYNLAGVLFKPAGAGPFPAVILSHGFGGNARGYSAMIAREMRNWGLVCIATNYTHAGGVPLGSPGTSLELGASNANVMRARKCREILASLGYVHMGRVAAHGHSMGAFVTAALVGAYPDDFRAASHTAGGVHDQKLAWTKTSQAQGIIAPYQMHHGDDDNTVPLADDQALDSLLQTKGTTHQLHVYAGFSHSAISFDSTMYQRVRDWYTTHGLFNLSAQPVTTVSAASYRQSPLATEAIVSAFGSKLATATVTASDLPLPTSLAGTSIKVRDSGQTERLAPLFFVSPAQVNYQIPPGTASGAATITVISGDGSVSSEAPQIAAVAPGLFTANANGREVAAALALRVKADGMRSFEPVAQFDIAQNKFVAVPISLGSETDQVFLILFATGVRYRSSLSTVVVKLGGEDAQVTFAGAQDGFVGLDQINVSIPRILIGRGEIDVELTVEGQAANVVKISIAGQPAQ